MKISLDTVTRDYIDTAIARQHPDWRHVLLHPWIPIDISHVTSRRPAPIRSFTVVIYHLSKHVLIYLRMIPIKINFQFEIILVKYRLTNYVSLPMIIN